jgi:hypothetical protein
MIYKAAEKNNSRLDRTSMRRFQGLLDDLGLVELHLSGRLFTWSNGRERPTLERLDRAFAAVDWINLHPSHHQRCLLSDCFDHAPLLLVLNSEPWARPRFRFDNYWTRMEGFLGVVTTAWAAEPGDADACRALDHKLRSLARALLVGYLRRQCQAAAGSSPRRHLQARPRARI